ncbi:MAG: hypothetical protein R3F11_04305 [Verrucomicrobiales bacterium]
MDPRVVDDPAYRGEIIEGLTIRTPFLVVPNDEFFNNPRGIYANPRRRSRVGARGLVRVSSTPAILARTWRSTAASASTAMARAAPAVRPKQIVFGSSFAASRAKRLRYRLFRTSPSM